MATEEAHADSSTAAAAPTDVTASSTAPAPAATPAATLAGAGADAVSAAADGIAAVHITDNDQIAKLQSVYDKLVVHHPVSVGKALSSKERDEKGLSTSTLVYGEISFDSYAIAFQKVKTLYGGLPEAGGKFYDIGSGTGKPALAAALLHPFDEIVGIEILEGLHSVSLELLEKWNSDIKPDLPEAHAKTKIDFLLGDATKYDWSDATMWFANSTCFDETLMRKLAVLADKQAVGTFAVTFTKRLPSSKWKVLESKVYQQSWGGATTFIQVKEE